MEMFCQYLLDPDDNFNMNFDNLLEKAIRLLRAKEKLAHMIQVEKKNYGVKNLVKKCNHRTCISSTPNCIIAPPFVLTYQPFNFPAATFVQITSLDY